MRPAVRLGRVRARQPHAEHGRADVGVVRHQHVSARPGTMSARAATSRAAPGQASTLQV